LAQEAQVEPATEVHKEATQSLVQSHLPVAVMVVLKMPHLLAVTAVQVVAVLNTLELLQVVLVYQVKVLQAVHQQRNLVVAVVLVQ
jgi:hypothetical protein